MSTEVEQNKLNTTANIYKMLKPFLSERNGPDRRIALQRIIDYVINSNSKSIDLVMLWGASKKDKATKSDKDALLYLFHFIKELQLVFEKPCSLKIIFTDTHVHLNGYELDQMESYYADIKYHLRKHKFTYTYCSEILKDYINENGFEHWKGFINNILEQPIELFSSTGISEEQASVFNNYAKKHCNRLANSQSLNEKILNANEASKAYLYLSSIEKKIIEQHFTDSLFITYMNKEEDFVLPNLPIVRLYSVKSGLRTRPWFSN